MDFEDVLLVALVVLVISFGWSLFSSPSENTISRLNKVECERVDGVYMRNTSGKPYCVVNGKLTLIEIKE